MGNLFSDSPPVSKNSGTPDKNNTSQISESHPQSDPQDNLTSQSQNAKDEGGLNNSSIQGQGQFQDSGGSGLNGNANNDIDNDNDNDDLPSVAPITKRLPPSEEEIKKIENQINGNGEDSDIDPNNNYAYLCNDKPLTKHKYNASQSTSNIITNNNNNNNNIYSSSPVSLNQSPNSPSLLNSLLLNTNNNNNNNNPSSSSVTPSNSSSNEISGWLSKRGVFNTSFQRRFFKMKEREEALYYYDTENSRLANGCIYLSNALIESVPESKFSQPFVFSIASNLNTRVYMLKADSQLSLDNWINTLRHKVHLLNLLKEKQMNKKREQEKKEKEKALSAKANNNNNNNNLDKDKDSQGQVNNNLTQSPTSRNFSISSKPSGSSSISIQDFDLIKVIGKGSFGKVIQVRKKSDGLMYAMKVLKKAVLLKRKQILHTQAERRILQEIRHPFLVHLKFAFQNEAKLYLIMEYFSGGELFFHLKKMGQFQENQAKFYAAELLLALQALHSNQIVYRDLKPENVLLDKDGHVRLADFGLCKAGITNKNLTNTFCGTPEYLAPEVLLGNGYGPAVDWWSLGMLIFEMTSGLPAFYDKNLKNMYRKIVSSKLVVPSYTSSKCNDIIIKLLEKDPKKRLGYGTDALEIKNHPWFAGIDWEKLYNKGYPAPFIPKNGDDGNLVLNQDSQYNDPSSKNGLEAKSKNIQSEAPTVVDSPVTDSHAFPKIEFPDFTFTGSVAPAASALTDSSK